MEYKKLFQFIRLILLLEEVFNSSQPRKVGITKDLGKIVLAIDIIIPSNSVLVP